MNLCEVYTSIQGEGPNTGKPTTFVRFGGCNLRCPGWGEGTLPDGTVVPGCDTVFAVYPEWGDTWHSKTVAEVFDEIPSEPKRVCLTGGEPLIQRTKELNELVPMLLKDGFEIDLFTNGTQLLDKYPWTQLDWVSVVMDWKLSGSGEGGTFDVDNLAYLRNKDAVKFVIRDVVDFGEAGRHIEGARRRYLLGNEHSAQIWFSPVWGVMDPQKLAIWVQDAFPEARLNIQTHKYIWPADARGV